MSPIRLALKTDLRKKRNHPPAEGHLQDTERILFAPRGKAEGKISSLPKGRSFFRADRPYSPGGEGFGFPDGG